MNKQLKTHLYNYGKEVVSLMRKRLIAADKDATGELINSLYPYIEEGEDGKVYLYIEMANHGIYVDQGRRPYPRDKSKWPPITPIRKWVNIRGIQPRDGLTIRQLPYAIRASIGIKGIAPLNFINLYMENIDLLNDMVEQGAYEDLELMINEFIKNNFN